MLFVCNHICYQKAVAAIIMKLSELIRSDCSLMSLNLPGWQHPAVRFALHGITCILYLCASLIIVVSNLDPKLSEDDVQDLVKTSLSSVVSCVPNDDEQNLLLMEKTLMALSDLLKELLIKNMTMKTFSILLQV